MPIHHQPDRLRQYHHRQPHAATEQGASCHHRRAHGQAQPHAGSQQQRVDQGMAADQAHDSFS